ncbi:Uncharacterized protein OBRU01_06720 [Operophtera brumata]|uniref:ZSWIM4-8 C-terminal domain-containing protein n=1 Tax=Operophtera brumata TaxID=104452 RepID=A0A0L7LK71_OPEBR|nr:Uncharacterized protein OBRU01_06720 [Operophtera brumata]
MPADVSVTVITRCDVNSVVYPFVLHELCSLKLTDHSFGRYIQCIHQKLYHITAVEYEEFVSIVLSARTAFQLTPEGNAQFKEWLASLRKSKTCKKDLWTQLNAALQTNGK